MVTVYYAVTNEAARATIGQAGYNVSPPTAGIYFEKINCFCFTEQTMKPGEKRDMAVVFYVDPKLAADSEQDGLNLITLPTPSIRCVPRSRPRMWTRERIRRWRGARRRRNPAASELGNEGGAPSDARASWRR